MNEVFARGKRDARVQVVAHKIPRCGQTSAGHGRQHRVLAQNLIASRGQVGLLRYDRRRGIESKGLAFRAH